MEIKNFVQIYDNCLNIKTIGNLIRYANTCEFVLGTVGSETQSGIKNENIRKAYTTVLSQNSKSLSNVHWHNFLFNFFSNRIKQYAVDMNAHHFSFTTVFDIEILKYEKTFHYTWHTDHFARIPRTMSCILLLNNDYEGGNLCFANPDMSEPYEIEVKPNRLIIWPSNFMYPHTVKPVTKGKRYSVVAWAI